MAIYKPSWFSNDHIMVSTAHTCGLTKGGRPLPIVDPLTGKRVQTLDPETHELVDVVDDQLLADMEALKRGETTSTLRFIRKEEVDMKCAVPVYYDKRLTEHFRGVMSTSKFAGFSYATIADLIADKIIETRGGHGSPSHDERIGKVPYIKVSDLRAGLVNINPTNRVPRSVAEKFWKGDTSGLRPYDLLCPERTSKNIGDFCILMPGQEQVVTTKEVIVLRPGPAANFDAFYLLWVMTLKIVRDQWKRVIFMQTNREDVGKRFLEIEIPIAPSAEKAESVSATFRNYYLSIAQARTHLGEYLHTSDDHHFFVSGAEALDTEVEDSIDESQSIPT
jgi:type I restriction enzyme M protein